MPLALKDTHALSTNCWVKIQTYKIIATAPIKISSLTVGVCSRPNCRSITGVTQVYPVFSPYALIDASPFFTRLDKSTKIPKIGINTKRKVNPLFPTSCNRRQVIARLGRKNMSCNMTSSTIA